MPNFQDLLDTNRRELLDLSTRNRLLSIPASGKARVVRIHDELTSEVYRLLVTEKRAMTFLPGRTSGVGAAAPGGDDANSGGADDEVAGLPQPDDDVDATSGLPKRHVDLKLQTALTSEGLQRRLLDLHQDALTTIEEQGVNILYLALGQLKWFEASHSDIERYAPLILIPVELERAGANDKFKIKARDEDLQENLSLAAKLKAEFQIELPKFPDGDDFDPHRYFQEVAEAVSAHPQWEVMPNAMTLGFFSFAKFLMYRDLDSANWPNPSQLLEHPFITGLMHDGFPHEQPPFSDDAHLDELIPAEKLDHVVDADSSQTLAIELVRRGRSVVIQGPPGTGKSQSITNIIATAVLDGKRVLFVAEKMAALEVVKRRLEREGLGALCLELHSKTGNKRTVLEEIGRTWKLGRPIAPPELDDNVPQLAHRRTDLNHHVASLHTPLDPSGIAPFTIIGRLAALTACAPEAAGLTLQDAERWTPEDLRERRAAVREICERISDIGQPRLHPWNGVNREMVLKVDYDSIISTVSAARTAVADAQEAAAALAGVLRVAAPTCLQDCPALARMGTYVAGAPELDRATLCDGIWAAGLDGLRELLRHGETLHALRAELGASVTADAWSKDFRSERGHVAARGDSPLRILSADYRKAIAAVKVVANGPIPKKHSERLAFIDKLIQGQQARQAILAAEGAGTAAFGVFWKSEHTDWAHARAILDWVAGQSAAGLGAEFRQTFAETPGVADAGQRVTTLELRANSAQKAIETVTALLTLDSVAAFGTADILAVPFQTWIQRCDRWMQSVNDLSKWIGYNTHARRARTAGLASLVERLEDGTIAAGKGAGAFDYTYYCQLYREAARRVPALAQFDGDLHSRRVEEFKTLDRDRLALAKFRLLASHHAGLPERSGAIGPTGILKGELEKKRNNRAVRRLIKDSGSVIQAIKPVFMMSPLSVAQFLEPGAVEFDLLVMDEASQIQPVDALGAIARCKQIVVVGDSRQMPPTQFFSRLTSGSPDGDSSDDDGLVQARDVESILGLCRARGLPERMLRWHYRSRHQSLIAVSNYEFYENQLYIVPSPWAAYAELGLRFNHVGNGVFDRGGAGTNRVEAQTVARAVIRHARENPKRSLGVAAFSIRQQQAIVDELELLRRENADTEPFFANRGTEPFFVKNLENLQGDERDVIFISIGYGRDSSGYMAMNFGPLSVDGGERRLNVLISRAKLRCEVFSSITADDIDLARGKSKGVHALKTFLAFAKTGKLATANPTGRGEDSPFETSVKRAIESLGHEVHTQVGLAGFFIDLAIVDQDRKGRYILGVECDGASYHSSRSARERDRLRQAVLEDHGWTLHRIWSTDWFVRPDVELGKIAAAIERAQARWAAEAEERPPEVTVEVTVETETAAGVEREVVLQLDASARASQAEPYAEASFDVPKALEPHEVTTRTMAEILLKVVAHEGPIHEDELVNRIRDLWGLQRAGARIHDAVARGVRSLLVSKQCVREDSCLMMPGAKIRIRDRQVVKSATLRKPELLPGPEIREAIFFLLKANHGAAKAELVTAVARLFGFRTTGALLRSGIEYQIKKLVRTGALVSEGGLLQVAAAPSRDVN